ncbi:MAG: phosphoribosylanthranilate isomerase [Candidatus Dormibacteria bacterium]
MRVKVCGITSVGDAEVALDAGADAIGMIFHPASPRRVEDRSALAISRRVRGRADCVGVLVDGTSQQLRELVDRFELSALQLNLRSCPMGLVEEIGVPVWPFLGLRGGVASMRIEWWAGQPVFVDTVSDDGSGGTGELPDLEIAMAVAIHRPVWLAGGLGPDNVAMAVARVRPFGVDASSRLESSPGVKDPKLVRDFVATARRAAAGSDNGNQP